jgi:TPR repeat protein
MDAFAKGAREEIARQQGATPTHADQPNAANLGWRYENGSGVQQDYAKAAYWYRQAAEQGDASAQNNFGRLLEMGRGVAQDPVAAVIWYGASAAQGSSAAQSNLTNLVPRLTPHQQRELGRRMRAALDAIPPATAPK